ncbi:MAG TPA: HAMP domain-containing sensor histidine kinase [Chloroflexota bacterium]|nr:HAMP domain-containing sensor histidine kinase [Chloroflexota bacterium]
MSLRLRLTLWYTGILTATVVVVFVAVYFVLQVFLVQQVNQLLAAREQQFSQALLAYILPDPAIRGGGFLRSQANTVINSNPDVYAQLVLPDATPVVWSQNLPGQAQLPVNSNVISTVVHTGRPVDQTLQVAGLSIRLVNFPLSANGSVVAVVQLGRDVSPTQAVLRFLRQILVFAGAAGVLVAFAAGWLLSRRALQPIQRVADTARDIGTSKDFGRRVDYRGPNDELGRLTATFNQMIEEIQTAYQQLESSLTAQRRFVADASHELRTPLTTIRGNLGLLASGREVSGEDSREALEDMTSEAERMSRLVANLLTLARADAGLHFEKQPVSLDQIVHAVDRQAQVLASQVRLAVGDIDTAVVQGNADYLKQLLLILVDNALKNTPPGGVVELSQIARDGSVALTVRDTGRGIPAEALPHIFERFYQADRSRTGGGTGLGLSIARWIAREHDGDIEVHSLEGQGSTFVVRLPCIHALDAASVSTGPLASSVLG